MTDKVYDRGKKKTLTKLNIEEISGVDVPAQGLATVKLIKQKDENNMSSEAKIEALEKQLNEQKSKYEELAKKVEEDAKKKAEEEEAKKQAEEEAKKQAEEMKKKELEDAEKALAKAKGEEHQPVLYKSITGMEYTDQAQAELAKQNDTLSQKLAKIEDMNKRVELEKKASELCKNLKGTDDVKVAVVKALETVTDESLRKGAEEMLKAADNAMADMFKSKGSASDAEGAQNDSHERLTKMAADHQAKHPDLTREQAYAVVAQTEAGRDLLRESRKEA